MIETTLLIPSHFLSKILSNCPKIELSESSEPSEKNPRAPRGFSTNLLRTFLN